MVRKDISKEVIFKLRPKNRINGHFNSMCRTSWHMEKVMTAEQTGQVGLLSGEPRLEGLEMRARGRHGPNHGEIYKLRLKSLDSILSFLHGTLSHSPKRPLGFIPSVR